MQASSQKSATNGQAQNNTQATTLNNTSATTGGVNLNATNANQLQLQQILKKLQDMYGGRDFKKVYELAVKTCKENTTNLDVLKYKMKAEEELGKVEDALHTANLILMIQPYYMDSHQTKIRLLKKLQKYNELSDSLLATKTLFPQLSFTQE